MIRVFLTVSLGTLLAFRSKDAPFLVVLGHLNRVNLTMRVLGQFVKVKVRGGGENISTY